MQWQFLRANNKKYIYIYIYSEWHFTCSTVERETLCHGASHEKRPRCPSYNINKNRVCNKHFVFFFFFFLPQQGDRDPIFDCRMNNEVAAKSRLGNTLRLPSSHWPLLSELKQQARTITASYRIAQCLLFGSAVQPLLLSSKTISLDGKLHVPTHLPCAVV